jgi:PPP family 3-phenylpropionic acid transporter
MKVSLVMYALKHIVTFFATNVWGIYIASFLQIGAYAVFTPASVYFVNQIVSKTDVLMGQTVNMMFITMAGVLGSLLGGILMDVFSVHIVLGIGIVLTLAGTLLCFAGMARRKEEQPLVLDEEL